MAHVQKYWLQVLASIVVGVGAVFMLFYDPELFLLTLLTCVFGWFCGVLLKRARQLYKDAKANDEDCRGEDF